MNTTTSSINALRRAAKSCVAEANRADRLGQPRYAAELRKSARTAMAEVAAIRPPAPVSPADAARRERARAFARVITQGLH
jgi:hypothetical protein